MADARDNEDDQETAARRYADANRHVNARDNEDDEETSARRIKDA